MVRTKSVRMARCNVKHPPRQRRNTSRAWHSQDGRRASRLAAGAPSRRRKSEGDRVARLGTRGAGSADAVGRAWLSPPSFPPGKYKEPGSQQRIPRQDSAPRRTETPPVLPSGCRRPRTQARSTRSGVLSIGALGLVCGHSWRLSKPVAMVQRRPTMPRMRMTRSHRWMMRTSCWMMSWTRLRCCCCRRDGRLRRGRGGVDSRCG